MRQPTDRLLPFLSYEHLATHARRLSIDVSEPMLSKMMKQAEREQLSANSACESFSGVLSEHGADQTPVLAAEAIDEDRCAFLVCGGCG